VLQTKVILYLYHGRVNSEEFLRWYWIEVYITIRWHTASWYARNSCEKRYSLFYFQLMITST